jgi:hypothetical protein
VAITVEGGRRCRAGDLWGSVSTWFSGRWHWRGADEYSAEVRQRLAERVWRTRWPDGRAQPPFHLTLQPTGSVSGRPTSRPASTSSSAARSQAASCDGSE